MIPCPLMRLGVTSLPSRRFARWSLVLSGSAAAYAVTEQEDQERSLESLDTLGPGRIP